VSSSPETVNVTRYVLIAIALLAVAAVIWVVADVIVIAFGGIVVAAVLRAMADPLARVTGWKGRWALLAVIGALLIACSALFWLFGRQATQQFLEMREQLPAAIEKVQTWLSESRLGAVALDFFQQGGEGGPSLSSAGAAFSATLGGLANLLLIVFVGIYLAADPRLYRDGALRLLPPARRPQVRGALNDAGTALRKWLVAQIIVMAAVGVMVGAGLALLGVPLWLSLGLLAGLFEFVPVAGPIAAAIPAVLLAFSQGPQTALYVLLLYILVQQVESNILTPLVQRWAVDLPPVIALLAIVVCGLLFGVLGIIFATPMAVVVVALVQHLYVEDRRGETGRGQNPEQAGMKHVDAVRAWWGRPGWERFVHGLAAGAFVLAMALYGWIAYEVAQGEHVALENAVMQALRREGVPIGPAGFESVMRDVTALGSAFVIVTMTLFMTGFLLMQGKRRVALLIVAATAGGQLANHLLKNATDRARPDAALHRVEVRSASFPSGHAMGASVFYITVGALLARTATRPREKVYLLGAALLLTAAIGFSRVYLGVHYPSDVLAAGRWERRGRSCAGSWPTALDAPAGCARRPASARACEAA
jgi:predicted PurR-regulated permease PerM